MKAAELAEELAEFWFSAIARASWEARLKIFQEIDAQLLADLEKRSEYEEVWPRFVAAVIERLGVPPVTNEAQAKIYASSINDRHRDAASAWIAHGTDTAAPTADVQGRNRRRFARQPIDGITELWFQGRSAPCRLVDLSPGGARVVPDGVEPIPGTAVRVALPNAGIRDATVVFRNNTGVGLQFADQPAAA